MTIAEKIAEYLRTGHSGPLHPEWPGASILERERRASDDLLAALVAEVKRRAAHKGWGARVEVPSDMVAFTRRRIEPMVRGLFARAEHEPILALLERSIVLVTDGTVQDVLREADWLPTSWKVANLYLASVGAKPLGDDGVHVGLSENLRSYVTPEYFERREPFVDFLVHECAHVLHDCKLERLGLRATRRRERLVELEFRERETFAYCCEAFATVVGGRSPGDRRDLAEQLAVRKPYPDEAVDIDKVEAIVAEAAAARNGWRVILRRCAPAAPPRYRVDRESWQRPDRAGSSPAG